MKKTKSSIASLVLVFALLISMNYAQATELNSGVPCGSIESGPNLTDAQILSNLMNDQTLSRVQKQQVTSKLLKLEKVKQKMTINSLVSDLMASGDCLMYVDPIMQETNNWCAAATIQQTLNYFGVTYASQSSIMNTTGSGPSLATVLSYVNDQQSTNTYIRKTSPSESNFQACISVSSSIGAPIIFTMKATCSDVSSYNWPYQTNGHFTNLCGYSMYDDYRIADPYYFDTYVGTGSGIHWRSFDQIWTVNTQHFGTTSNLTFGW